MRQLDRFELVVTICTAEAIVVATSQRHMRLLGRGRDDVVGHSCREWVAPAEWDESWAELQVCIGQGRPGLLHRHVQRSDGVIVPGFLALQPLGDNLALCIGSIVDPTIGTASPAHTAAYIEELARELSDVTASAGLDRLTAELDGLSGAAARAFRSHYL